MVAIIVQLQEHDAEWLSARIDDAKPTLADVAKDILLNVSHDVQTYFGRKP